MSKRSNSKKKTNNTKFDQPPIKTQFLIFTLLGDYIINRDGKIWTSSILHLMELLDISERAVRSALSRMSNKGWIKAQRLGRNSQYSLTKKGVALLNRGTQRIFEVPFTNWDNKWHLIIYSLPEIMRDKRHTLRTQLSWLGFGRLAPGTWISPRPPSEDLQNTFGELQIESHIQMFHGVSIGPTSNSELAKQCWDLAGLEQQYLSFIQQFKPEFNKMNAQNKQFDPEDCFRKRFWLTHQFQSFPLNDPNLPTPILPPNWIGTTARNLFNTYHKLLGTQANLFIDKVLADHEKLISRP